MAFDPVAIFRRPKLKTICVSKEHVSGYKLSTLPNVPKNNIINGNVKYADLKKEKNIKLPTSIRAIPNVKPENSLQMENRFKILNALRDEKYDFHTISGLEKDTNIPSELIKIMLENNNPHIRKCAITDRNGNALYTLAEKPIKLRERLAITKKMLGNIG